MQPPLSNQKALAYLRLEELPTRRRAAQAVAGDQNVSSPMQAARCCCPLLRGALIDTAALGAALATHLASRPPSLLWDPASEPTG